MCLAAASTDENGPGAPLRGGALNDGPLGGPLAVVGDIEPFRAAAAFGFRCAR